MDVPRDSAKSIRRKISSGDPIVLVCGYDSDDRFREVELEGAISWSSFRSRLSSLPLDHEIVFYCA